VEYLTQIENVNVVGEASDIITAKEEISKLDFDLAIFDIVMPNGIGIELIKHTKKINPLADVILMTNYSTIDYKDICLKEGADYFYRKSNLDEMLLMIEQLAGEGNNVRN